MFIDILEVAVPALMVSCDIATAGAAIPNIPPIITKAAMTAVDVLVMFFIKQCENTVDLKDP
jgi:hypothetical protein